ncbi:MAG: sulfatase [Acidobacteria bacterium]|nr:sulfatase [Acidobacteriota bacterium]
MNRPCISRCTFLNAAAGIALLAAAASFPGCGRSEPARKPNIILIFCDDLGYGDLGSYGHPTIRTPNLDRLAVEGQRWTNFYAAASVCTPSRAGLLTGRYPIRSGMCDDNIRVLFPWSAGGIPENEVTLAEALKAEGYATACIGKWHLGHLPGYLPTNNGFDYYFGIPYSNDMDKVRYLSMAEEMDPKTEEFNVPLMRNEEVIERPADQNTLTKRYVEESVSFIRSNRDKPFFLYLAHTMPHIPLFASVEFNRRSPRGPYGDTVEEIDAGVGRIVETLRETGIDENTLVVFTSDNGPWWTYREHSGSAGLLRDGKGSTWEGGMREPAIFWWPGRVQPRVVADLGSTMDIYTTVCSLAGAPVPDDRIVDGMDLGPALLESGPGPREVMIYYSGRRVFAVRKGPYKAHYFTKTEYIGQKELEHDPPLLYNLNHDPSEKYDIAADHPEILADLERELQQHAKDLVPGENQLIRRIE